MPYSVFSKTNRRSCVMWRAVSWWKIVVLKLVYSLPTQATLTQGTKMDDTFVGIHGPQFEDIFFSLLTRRWNILFRWVAKHLKVQSVLLEKRLYHPTLQLKTRRYNRYRQLSFKPATSNIPQALFGQHIPVILLGADTWEKYFKVSCFVSNPLWWFTCTWKIFLIWYRSSGWRYLINIFCSVKHTSFTNVTLAR